MAYRIDYDLGLQKAPDLGKILRIQTMTCVCFLGTMIGVSAFWAEGAAVLRRVFLATKDPMARAVTDLAAAWRLGEGFYGTMAAFCREIICGAV